MDTKFESLNSAKQQLKFFDTICASDMHQQKCTVKIKNKRITKTMLISDKNNNLKLLCVKKHPDLSPFVLWLLGGERYICYVRNQSALKNFPPLFYIYGTVAIDLFEYFDSRHSR